MLAVHHFAINHLRLGVGLLLCIVDPRKLLLLLAVEGVGRKARPDQTLEQQLESKRPIGRKDLNRSTRRTQAQVSADVLNHLRDLLASAFGGTLVEKAAG